MTSQTRRENARRMMQQVGAPMTAENLTRLAVQYERAYQRHRTSANPPARHLLAGEIATARAYYSLAREARNG